MQAATRWHWSLGPAVRRWGGGGSEALNWSPGAFPEHCSTAFTLGPTANPDASQCLGWAIILLLLEETNEMKPAVTTENQPRVRFL